MINDDLLDAQAALRRYRSFEECLLDDVRWLRFGSQIDLVFNYVWDEGGQVRDRVLEEPRLVTVRCFGVQELMLSNHLTQAMLDEPDRLNWGLSEVAVVRFEPRRLDGGDGVQVAVLWEGGRALHVIAAGLEVAEVL